MIFAIRTATAGLILRAGLAVASALERAALAIAPWID
jgi:hypothetical protein